MKVSVILSSYNHESFIGRSIESVLNQTFTDFELIIVDDCSTDGSWDIIQKYQDERIVKVRMEKNLRIVGIYNAIMHMAKGEYIAIHHSDDMWMPEKLEKQVDFLEKEKQVGAVFTGVRVIDENDEEYADKDGFYYSTFTTKNRNRFEWLRTFFYEGNCLCHPSVLIRKQLFEEKDLFAFGFAQTPDLSRWIKICLGHEIYILPEQLTMFRVLNKGKNTSGSRPDNTVRSSIEIYNLLKLYLQLRKRDDFFNVFPQAREFADGETFIPEYALAKVCTEPQMTSYTRLFGYELMFELMADRNRADIIEKQYNYSFRDLIADTGKEDIFHVLPEKSGQIATVYLDFGDGFSEENILRTNYYLPEHYVFNQKFELNKEDANKKVLKLRFDPAEGIFTKCQNIKLLIDDKEIDIQPYNSFPGIKGDTVFFNQDPMYISVDLNTSIKKIELTGEIKRISIGEMEKIIGSMHQMYVNSKLLEEEVKDKEQLLIEMEQRLNSLEKEYQQSQQKLQECETELNRIKSIKPIAMLYKLLK